MPTIRDSNHEEVNSVLGQVEARARAGATLQAAAQAFAQDIYERYRDSLVLSRIYATVAYGDLPQHIQRFARAIAEEKGVASMLQPRSTVLTLLGTAGQEPEWNDPLRSAWHLGIPLVAASFVRNLPMTTALMTDLGLGLDWLDDPDSSIVAQEVGQTARVFFVPDARTAVDPQGRRIVPAADFVADHEVRTVFGLGGGYADGMLLVMLFFTRELLERQQAETFLPLVGSFKLGTEGTVLERKIFE